MTTKTQSYFSADLVSQAEKRAVEDEAFRSLLDAATKAGVIYGTAVHGSQATDHFKALGDAVAPFALAILAGDASDAAKVQFRDLCGVVNAALKAAQSAAKRAAISKCEAAKMADYAKKARDRIVKALERHMAQYQVKVNWQEVKVTSVEEPVAETDADKAKAAIVRAFKLDATVATQTLAGMDLLTLEGIRDAVSLAIEARKLEAHLQQQPAEVDGMPESEAA